jgi:hypothetical protein
MSRTSWRGLIASEDGGRDEPATVAHWRRRVARLVQVTAGRARDGWSRG